MLDGPMDVDPPVCAHSAVAMPANASQDIALRGRWEVSGICLMWACALLVAGVVANALAVVMVLRGHGQASRRNT